MTTTYGTGERYAYQTVALAARDDEQPEEAVVLSDGTILIRPQYWPEEEEIFAPDWDILGCW